MKAFISIGEAAEMLLGAGFKVSLVKTKLSGSAQETTGIAVGDEVAVAWGYKDGSTWKFKTETVQDFIDDSASAKIVPIITIQIHADKSLYRFIGPHGVSHAASSKHDLMKKIKFVYGDVAIKQEISVF